MNESLAAGDGSGVEGGLGEGDMGDDGGLLEFDITG